MKIDSCELHNFTVFKAITINFRRGINILIGANGTGKSHLLKILYAMTQHATGEKGGNENRNKIKTQNLLLGLFKPEGGDISLLLRSKKSHERSDLVLCTGKNSSISADIYADNRYNNIDPAMIVQSPNAKGIFIPPNEVLAIYPGFIASYEKRELAFDQTYYDICKALSAAPLKTKPPLMEKLAPSLESILGGPVILKGDRFYVGDHKSEKRLEAHLLAEGHRKLAALVHLINNGSINENTILFWDEPEANLNPKLIKTVADFLLALASAGAQIFIATHDYLLTGELSLAAEYNTTTKAEIQFIALSRKGNSPAKAQSGGTLADLTDNPILDEFAAHYEREQAKAIEELRKG